MKRPGTIREWLGVIFTAVAIIATVCVAYEALNQRVGVTEKDLVEVKADVKIHNVAIPEMRKDISYIREGIDDLKEGFGMPVKRRPIIDPNG